MALKLEYIPDIALAASPIGPETAAQSSFFDAPYEGAAKTVRDREKARIRFIKNSKFVV